MLLTEFPPPAAMTKVAPTCSLTGMQLSHLRIKVGPGAAAHCHAVRYRLSPPVDPQEIYKNFDEIIQRWQVQLPLQTGSGPTPRLWIESVPAPSESKVAERRRTAEIKRPIEVLGGPLCRAVLLQYQDGTADFIVVAHRAALDRYSVQLIATAALRRMEEEFHEALPWLATPTECTMEPNQRLEELQNADYACGAAWGFGSGKDKDLGESRLQMQVDFVEGVDSASFNAAVGLVVAHYSGQNTALVATLAQHPHRPQGAIGAYDGICLIPVSCSPALSAGELLRATKHQASRPFPWYTLDLADELAKSCKAGGKPLTATLFMADESDITGLLVPSEYVPCFASPFPLTITCAPETTGTFRLTCFFRLRDFAASVVTQFLEAVIRVHRQLRLHPEITLAQIDIFDSEHMDPLTARGHSNLKLPAHADRIEQAFVRNVCKTPNAPALTYGEEHLTYRELDQRANRMADGLRGCGVQVGDLVGVCMERSLDLVPVLLAILKAGAAYVPMDISYPIDRLAYMIGDARISVVIASESELPAGNPIRVLRPEELLPPRPQPRAAPASPTSDGDAAYVIYTSGSTGRPKGVVVPHRNVISLLAATTNAFGLCPTDIWTLFHSSAFDFSVWEIWGSLLTGGHLVVVPYWVSRSPEEFCDLLAKEHVTVLNQTPSAFAQLLEIDRERPVTSTLRLVIFGGEPLDAHMMVQWFDRHPESRCRVVNMFGITETTDHVTLENITRQEALTASRSVGHALEGWYFYVMDLEGRPLPPGVAGEIYVGGAGVALFYLNRPELTAERFVPDPFTGARMYRSGDRGRLRPDGRLEHLGRLDTQVKIRGFRIELDEIRSVLLEAPGVVTTAVVMRSDDPADAATAKLCAYVVLNGSTTEDVHSHLIRVLPDYMVPSVLIELPSLPLTNNGKLDTASLPLPINHRQTELSQSLLEKTGKGNADLAASLLKVWEKVLGVPVGLDDNFFNLGGNSLYAMRIATAMRKQGLPKLSARELYTQQTVRRLVTSFAH